MNVTVNKRRFAAAALLSMVALGVETGIARAPAAGNGIPTDRARIAAIAAERDTARANLAAAEKKLGILRRTIQRYAEELACVEEIKESLQRRLESRPGGTMPVAEPMQ